MPAPYDGWLWPVELHPTTNDKRKPVISDGFKAVALGGARQHLGIDVMYRRRTSGEPSGHELTKHFEMPTGTIDALAAGPGDVFSVDSADSHGVVVTIDHHNVPGVGPRVTVYRHLTRASVVKGERVNAGHPVGKVGFDPSSGSKTTPSHLHFELWDTSRPRNGLSMREAFSVDPEPVMGTWGFRGRDGSFERGDPSRAPQLVAEAGDELGSDGMTGPEGGAELAAHVDLTIEPPVV